MTWLTIGAPPDRVQALEAKLVDAADLSYPFDVQAQKKVTECYGTPASKCRILLCRW